MLIRVTIRISKANTCLQLNFLLDSNRNIVFLSMYRLVENAKKVIEADFSHRALLGHSPFDRGNFHLLIDLLFSI